MGVEEDLGLSGNMEKKSKKDEVKDCTKLDDDAYQKEKDERKKKKKRKLEPAEEKDERKEKKKRKLEPAEKNNTNVDKDDDARPVEENGDGNSMEIVEKKKKKTDTAEDVDFSEGNNNKDKKKKKKEKKKKKTDTAEDGDFSEGNSNKDKKKKKKEKKKKKTDTTEDGDFSEGNSNKDKKKKKSKKVRFSGEVEIFPLPDCDPSSETDAEIDIDQDKEDVVRGKRFSREEDEKVKEAVLKYIEEHELGEEGLDKVMHCRDYPEVKNCWKEIGKVLPYRPYTSIYYRAHIIFERCETRKWTPEEIEHVLKHHAEHGPEWKKMAVALGKHRFHVKDAWRRTKLVNKKTGGWSQEEYQSLFDLVNMDIKMKVFEEKQAKHGMLRDNICWTAISDKLSTRTNSNCCRKWYDQLTSSMVNEGEWADVDDYRLVIALFNLDACCIEDVEWDDLLDDRSGDVCRKRWNQMVRHLGKSEKLSFAERVEILSKRYCPDVLEPREIWDSKPYVE